MDWIGLEAESDDLLATSPEAQSTMVLITTEYFAARAIIRYEV